jgi:hypothetical protein
MPCLVKKTNVGATTVAVQLAVLHLNHPAHTASLESIPKYPEHHHALSALQDPTYLHQVKPVGRDGRSVKDNTVEGDRRQLYRFCNRWLMG